MTIIQISPLEGTNYHPIQSQSHRNECWEEGYIEVPQNLESKVLECCGYCDLVITNGVLIDVVLQKVDPQKELDLFRTNKLAELSQVCNSTITAGCDVTLSDGTKGHISMKDEDQINLMSAIGDVQNGAAGAPYHLDGTLCRIYPAADIAIIAAAAKQHKLYHTTYCNHLNEWVRGCETVEAVQAITYGSALPEDLAANFAEVLGNGK